MSSSWKSSLKGSWKSGVNAIVGRVMALVDGAGDVNDVLSRITLTIRLRSEFVKKDSGLAQSMSNLHRHVEHYQSSIISSNLHRHVEL